VVLLDAVQKFQRRRSISYLPAIPISQIESCAQIGAWELGLGIRLALHRERRTVGAGGPHAMKGNMKLQKARGGFVGRFTFCNCVFALLLTAANGLAQGTFQNLDFEEAGLYVAPIPVGAQGGSVDPTLAFPGWTVSGWGGVVFYNALSLGAPAISLIGPNFPNATGLTSLQGSYSVVQYYWAPYSFSSLILNQTGLVPSDANSITLLTSSLGPAVSVPRITLGGVDIPLAQVSGGRVAGDISAFAGQTELLTISISGNTLGDHFAYFDDIQFSSTAIPEPGLFALSALGALLLGWRVLERRRCQRN
jgi:hypothetical protein